MKLAEMISTTFDLLDLKTYVDEDVLKHVIEARKLKLRFNGGSMLTCMVTGHDKIMDFVRKKAGGNFAVDDSIVYVNTLISALYDIEHQALFCERDFTVKLKGALDQTGVTAQFKLSAGSSYKRYNVAEVLDGTLERIRKKPHVLDIKKVMTMETAFQ